ncbi:MAG: hypothetical protein QOD71_3391 [Thermoleophilaceae bacterium]|nr:hypothetical protein [Thermoleophilaceae bacterium]
MAMIATGTATITAPPANANDMATNASTNAETTMVRGDIGCGYPPDPPGNRYRGRGSRLVSTTSNALPGTWCSVWSWSLSQPGLGAPLTYQEDPLSARIMP